MPLTRHRLTITFYIGKQARASWIIDAFKDNDTTVAVRCYQNTIHGNRSHLQDGWLARDAANIETKRQEITHIMKGKNVRIDREPPSDDDGGRTIHRLTDIRL